MNVKEAHHDVTSYGGGSFIKPVKSAALLGICRYEN